MTSDASTTVLVVCEKCRRIRLVAFALLLVSTVLAGYLWGHFEHRNISSAAWLSAVFMLASLALVLVIEAVVAKVELQSKRLTLTLNAKDEEVRLTEEKVRELERSIDFLVKDDDMLRERLLSLAIHQAEDGEKAAHSAYRSAPPPAG